MLNIILLVVDKNCIEMQLHLEKEKFFCFGQISVKYIFMT